MAANFLLAAFGFFFIWGCVFLGVLASWQWKEDLAFFALAGNGFSGGALLAVSCFAVLPETFGDGFFLAAPAMLFGVFVTVWMEDHGHLYRDAGYPFVFQEGELPFWMASLPEAFLLGLFFMKPVLPLLCLLPLLAACFWMLGITFGKANPREDMPGRRMAAYLAGVSVPHGIFTALGGLLGSWEGPLMRITLGIVGGSLLYYVCGQILPEGGADWAGRIAAFFGLLGFLFGVLLLYWG